MAAIIPTVDVTPANMIEYFVPINNEQPSTQGIPEADWNEDHFGHIPIWHNIPLDPAQILTVGLHWFTSLLQGNVSVRTAVLGLRLALSLSAPEEDVNSRVFVQQPRPAQAEVNFQQIRPLPDLASFPGTPFTLRAQQIVAPPVAPAAGTLPAMPQTMPRVAAQPIPETDRQKQDSYCFLAAYLMRLVVKAPENIILSFENMKRRFETFYGPSDTVNRFSITLPIATAYREALQARTMIGTTYSHAIAFTQSTRCSPNSPNALGIREIGMLSYLCFLPFSYTGLHAYTLILDLRNYTKIKLGNLLCLFYADIMAPALFKITDLVRDHERTTSHPDRCPHFRYCALWGTHYFASLRSKNCPHLLFTIANAWKVIASSNVNADPERIMATEMLTDSMKRTLRRAGQIVGESLKKNMLGGVGASLVYSLAIENPQLEGGTAEIQWDQIMAELPTVANPVRRFPPAPAQAGLPG
ncbi:TPA_asm: N [Rhopalocnemis gammacytorhabdovirus 1]|nr:TPA_asm: N [Rhopalocnemis gammacytorhabdovirus 1]